MKKHLLTFMLLLLSAFTTNAQQTITREFKSLEANLVQAYFSNDARHFQQSIDAAGLIWPSKSGRTVMFMGAPWVAARFNGDINLAAYRTAAVQNIGRNGTEYLLGKIVVIAEDSLCSEFSRTRHRLYHLHRGDNAQTNPDFEIFPNLMVRRLTFLETQESSAEKRCGIQRTMSQARADLVPNP